MDKEDLQKAVDAWLWAWGLPQADASDPKDLRGQSIRVAKFTDEETSRFFFPRRTLVFQQRMAKEVAIILRKRGAKIVSVQLSVRSYYDWCAKQRVADSPEQRYNFASRVPADA